MLHFNCQNITTTPNIWVEVFIVSKQDYALYTQGYLRIEPSVFTRLALLHTIFVDDNMRNTRWLIHIYLVTEDDDVSVMLFFSYVNMIASLAKSMNIKFYKNTSDPVSN